jgi:predicted urease superfamily metal-dependent hydrolase
MSRVIQAWNSGSLKELAKAVNTFGVTPAERQAILEEAWDANININQVKSALDGEDSYVASTNAPLNNVGEGASWHSENFSPWD